MDVTAGISRRWRGKLVATLVAGLLAVPAASASAATVYGGPLPISYLNPDVTIATGEELTFYNLDFTAPHDVTSLDIGPDAQALFRSETVSAPTEVPVVGASSLGAGSYPYICSIHPNMRGTLTVTGSGGGGGGTDTTPPSLKVRAQGGKAKRAAKSGKLALKVTVNEPAKVKLVAKKGKTKVAKGGKRLKKGTSTLRAKLTKAGKKKLRRAKKVQLKVKARATDAAGNTTKKTFKVKLR